ncbi:4Fe-4S dicluster domain-containing protein [Selenihalanaerobacter shriftii]|uniref:Ferredoxin n=1 Tax=Selenihalanaerobacter shriftii TaxID=142842 RepID=A0A1T4PD21_9FIRM|nr:4Fe-4S dicluster domain-containing protein [Selenihalanaerobacter shriftii]SJZ89434.1 4Fe-4S binding domain-containing protein [Selenihalanaerobacter shriftii]
MFYLNKLFNLISNLDIESIKVKSHLCTKIRSPHSQCQRCIKNCSQDAITIKQEVNISQEKCKKCGQCYNVCPVGVFVIQESSDSKLISDAENIANFDQELVFSCQRVNLKRNMRKKEIKVNCLARLSEEILISMFKFDFKYLLLKSGKCAECELSGLNLIKESIKNSNNILSLFNNKKRIWLNEIKDNQIPSYTLKSLIFNEEEIKRDGTKEYPTKANDEVINRRELFTFLKSEIKGSFIKDKQKSNRDNDDTELPINRRILLSFIQQISKNKLIKNTVKQSVFWDVKLSIECDFCGICAKLCPNSALKIIKEEEKKEVLFNPALCTGCKLCQDVCTLDAIQFSNQEKMRMVLNNEQISILRGFKKKCLNCGDDFFATEDETVKCFGCSYQTKLMN